MSYLEKLLNLSADQAGGAKVEWVFLSDIAKVQRGASPRPISKYTSNDEEGLTWIKIGDTSSGSKYVEKTAKKLPKKVQKKSRLLKIGIFVLFS